jgi:hypothetical protein
VWLPISPRVSSGSVACLLSCFAGYISARDSNRIVSVTTLLAMSNRTLLLHTVLAFDKCWWLIDGLRDKLTW